MINSSPPGGSFFPLLLFLLPFPADGTRVRLLPVLEARVNVGRLPFGIFAFVLDFFGQFGKLGQDVHQHTGCVKCLRRKKRRSRERQGETERWK